MALEPAHRHAGCASLPLQRTLWSCDYAARKHRKRCSAKSTPSPERLNKVPASIDTSPSVKPQAGIERTFIVAALALQDIAEQAEAFINKIWVEQEHLERLKQHRSVSHEIRQLLQQYVQSTAKLQQVLTALRQTSAKISELSQQCEHPEVRERLARLHI
jgi:alpha-ketoglutarate-dependent taurine dioxygenase